MENFREMIVGFKLCLFAAVLEERRDDLEFFAQRIDKEAVSRLENFVSSAVVFDEFGQDASKLLDLVEGMLDLLGEECTQSITYFAQRRTQ